MKIFIIPIENKFQPENQSFLYPAHNKDYGVEQDFLEYLKKNPSLITTDQSEADWHYLPIFWTRWHLNHDFGKTGQEELQEEVNKKIKEDSKTFTICQYDDGPVVNLDKTTVFLSSRKSSKGIDIPLLCSSHKLLFFIPKKKYLASFIGNIANHPIRKDLTESIKDNKEILIVDGNQGKNFFIKNTLRSYIALCPRGYGGSSFRLFEAMQLGVVPFLIGDIDTRPFKEFIPWNTFSFFTSSTKEAREILSSQNKKELIKMGLLAKKWYLETLQYGRWPMFVIKELENLNNEKFN